MRERSELLQLDFQRDPLFKHVLERDKLVYEELYFQRRRKNIPGHILLTFNCCCSSLLSRANTVFVSLFLLMDA